MRLAISFLLACTLAGQSSSGVPSAPEPAFAWIIATDNPDLKVIVRLDDLPDSYRFEFWNRGEAPVITKEQLLQAIALVTVETKQSPERFCAIGPGGRILNYPCRVKPTLSAARTKR